MKEILDEQLKNRTIFPISEYGIDPIYNKDTFPKDFKAEHGKDIFGFNFNYRKLHPSTSIDYYEWCKNMIYNLDHGQIYETSEDNSLSTDVVSTTIHGCCIATKHGLGEFYWDNNRYTKLNRAGNKIPYNKIGLEMINNQIKKNNMRFGLNIGYALYVFPDQKLPGRNYAVHKQYSILVPVMGFKRY